MNLLIVFVVVTLRGTSADVFTYLGEGHCIPTGNTALYFSQRYSDVDEVKSICAALLWCHAVQSSPYDASMVTTHAVFDLADPIGKITFTWEQTVSISGTMWSTFDGNGKTPSTGVMPITLYPRSGYQCYIKDKNTDIDECQEGTDNCDTNAVCSDTAEAFTCTCKTGYIGGGFECTIDWNDYPGYAASWSGGDPQRLYNFRHPDLTASLQKCKEQCEVVTTCYAVEWRQDSECRLFDYKPSVYKYKPYWTVSVEKRPVGTADDWGSETGTFSGETFGSAFGIDVEDGFPALDASEDSSKPFGDSSKPFEDSSKPFGDSSKPFGDDPGKIFADSETFSLRWTFAGIGLGVVLAILGVKLGRRRGFVTITSVSEV